MSFWNEQGERVLFLQYVHTIKAAISWADGNRIIWHHANVYNRKTRELIKQIKKEAT